MISTHFREACAPEAAIECARGARASPRRRAGAIAACLTRLGSPSDLCVAEPILVALYSIPKVTLYPVILLIFGIGMPAKVAFGAIHGIFPVPISIFAMNAVRNINPTHLRTARVLRLPPWTLFSRMPQVGSRRRCPRSSPASASASRSRSSARCS